MNSSKKQPQIVVAWILLCCAMAVARGEAGNGSDSRSLAPSGANSGATPSGVSIPPIRSGSPLARDIRYYAQSTWSPRNFADAALVAGVPRLNTAPIQPQAPSVIDEENLISYSEEMEQYSTGMDDWRQSTEVELRYRARRFGFGLATAETRDLLSNLVLPAALRQDPRYLPASLNLGMGSRLAYAAESIFVTRDNAGRPVPNYAKWIGTVGAAVIAKHLYADRLGVPELNSNRLVWRYAGYSLAGDAATNVAHELLRASLKPDLTHIETEGDATEGHYYPLSRTGTLVCWARGIYGPRNFIQGGLVAGLPDIANEPVYPAQPPIDNKQDEITYGVAVMQYGIDMQSWRRSTDEELRYRGTRFIAGFSESETQQFLGNLVLPLSFRIDPRFIPSGGGSGLGSRFGNAFKEIAFARTNAGSQTLNLPLLGGTVGSAFLAQHLYYDRLGVPELTTNRVLAKTIGFNLTGDLLLNVVHEFLPHHGI